MSKRISNVQIIDAMVQCRREHEQWRQAKTPGLTNAMSLANTAGFDSGWRAAISYLKLHGALETTEGNEKEAA